MILETKRLKLVLRTREDVRAQIEGMTAEERAHVSPKWLARVEAATMADPWTLGFRILDRATGREVGSCGFKGPPDTNGIVEIAYGVAPDEQNRGYATEAAEALVQFAFGSGQVRTVRAHTFAAGNASTRVLTKCGFGHVGDVVDPEDGLVWRWEVAARL